MRYKDILESISIKSKIEEDFTPAQITRLEKWTTALFQKKRIQIRFDGHFLDRLSGREDEESYPHSLDDVAKIFLTIYQADILSKIDHQKAIVRFTVAGNAGEILINRTQDGSILFNTINLTGRVVSNRQRLADIQIFNINVSNVRLTDQIRAAIDDGTNMSHIRRQITPVTVVIYTYFRALTDKFRKLSEEIRKGESQDVRLLLQLGEKIKRDIQTLNNKYQNLNVRLFTNIIDNIIYLAQEGGNNVIPVNSITQINDGIRSLMSSIKERNDDIKKRIAVEQGLMTRGEYTSGESLKNDANRDTIRWMKQNGHDPRVIALNRSNQQLEQIANEFGALTHALTNREGTTHTDLNTNDQFRVNPLTGNLNQALDARRNRQAELRRTRPDYVSNREETRNLANRVELERQRQAEIQQQAMQQSQQLQSMPPVDRMNYRLRELLDKQPRVGENSTATNSIYTKLKKVYDALSEWSEFLPMSDAIQYILVTIENLRTIDTNIAQISRFSELGTPRKLNDFVQKLEQDLQMTQAQQ